MCTYHNHIHTQYIPRALLLLELLYLQINKNLDYTSKFNLQVGQINLEQHTHFLKAQYFMSFYFFFILLFQCEL